MPDDPRLREQDSKTIALHEPQEVRTWCRVFGCSEAELVAAVAARGKSAKAVRLYFETNPPKRK
jgi:hypothetical protein